ncbi:hypothetical protein P389DRAFT_163812 [Cystobasidium minutum MCA 4210]|uniref:uncharacterized protein n=1 Tax=Cystobasidium minutum MCA 4210 TaxID=1397322 RepID=UPI0034CE25FD|eukprot:jgi/Rhomi1/163812/estExt_Genewise1Plus.C_90062
MDTESHSNVLLIGAGEINFGSVEGSWNHSARLESIFGSRLNVLGIIDVDTTKAQLQLDTKIKAGKHGYTQSKVWKSLDEALPDLRDQKIDLAILGIPPHFRGSTQDEADLDLRLIKGLPQVAHWLVEKPISAKPFSETAGQAIVADAWQKSPPIVGVGYHLAALKAVTAAMDLIKEKNLKIMATQATYNMAYEYARKPSWWNKTISCGPIVEQATHLANLSLLFAGPANMSSVLAHKVEHDEAPGHLSKLGIDESSIPPESRVPRYTSASWKYESGAVGSLSHSIALHSNTYDTQLVIICDGHIIKLADLYTSSPALTVMGEGEARPSTTRFENDDPYRSQLEALIAGKPTCTYAQAMETYALTWAIRSAGEEQQKKLRS